MRPRTPDTPHTSNSIKTSSNTTLSQPGLKRQTDIKDFHPATSPNDIIDTYGDFPSPTKSSEKFRILYSNIYGISTINSAQDSHQIGNIADAHHASKNDMDYNNNTHDESKYGRIYTETDNRTTQYLAIFQKRQENIRTKSGSCIPVGV